MSCFPPPLNQLSTLLKESCRGLDTRLLEFWDGVMWLIPDSHTQNWKKKLGTHYRYNESNTGLLLWQKAELHGKQALVQWWMEGKRHVSVGWIRPKEATRLSPRGVWAAEPRDEEPTRKVLSPVRGMQKWFQEAGQWRGSKGPTKLPHKINNTNDWVSSTFRWH